MSNSRERYESFSFDRRDILAVSVLVATILVYFWPLVWTDKYIYGGLDIRRSLYLFRKVTYDTMRGGELPLWLPYLYCGMPLLASFLATPFYPLDLAFMFLRIPLPASFNWDLLIHLVAAQVFSFLFFRRMLRCRTAAVFCSLWFWNELFLGSITTGDGLNIRAMLLAPVVFYFVEAGLSESGRPRHFLFGSLAVSMQLLCGGLQITLYTMAAVTAYAVFELTIRAWRREDAPRLAGRFIAMIVCALAIASVHLMPAWEYSRLSVRATGIPWFRAWGLEPYQLIDYVIPMFEGEGKGHGYFGMAALVLAGYSLIFWKDRRKYFFAALGIISILYAMGGSTRVSSFLAGLPLVRDFRGPFRGSILFNFSVFVLAGGLMANALTQSNASRSRRQRVGFAVMSILLAGGFLMAIFLAHGHSEAFGARAAISGGFLTISVIAAFLLIFSDRLKTVAGFSLVALLACDLTLNYGLRYSPASVKDMFAEDWTVPLLKKESVGQRVAVYNTAHSNYFGLFGIEAANGHHPFPLARHAGFLPLLKNPKTASLAGVADNVYYQLGENRLPYDPPVGLAEETANQSLTVRNEKNPIESARVIIEPATIAPSPRAFLAQRYRVIPPEMILGAMRERAFDPSREAILEKNPGMTPAREKRSKQGTATVAARGANETVVETACDDGAILVLCDSYYPGWQAEIDGHRTELLRADYIFRAVVLPPGKHGVVFRFRPPLFFLGAHVSCAGIVIWLVWAFIVSRNRLL
ncbi:YfhO family protein [Candidatus Poribacteria bacterium]|nr:YfhO family protein [Candidatus Poribacteria bacterium]